MASPKINIIDPEKIQQYLLHDIAEGDQEIGAWLTAALHRFILQRKTNAELLQQLPKNAPAWLQNKWDVTGNVFHVFKPNAALKEMLRHIKDWLVAARASEEPFLKTLDEKGRPRRLMSLLSLEDAFNVADKELTRLRKKFAKVADKKSNNEIIMTFPDGSYIVKLLTTEALDYETSRMNHCVGQGSYDNALISKREEFYSLRDANNEPHVTFEVHRKRNALLQCKGKNNEPPIEKYMPMVAAFVDKCKFKLEEEPRYTGLLQDSEGKIHSIYHLPDDLNVEGDLNFQDCVWLKKIPARLKVSGKLDITNCKNLKTLPEVLEVGEDFFASGCDKIKHLPKRLRIGGSIDLSYCDSLEDLPEKWKVGGSLHLSWCSAIKALPGDLKVEKDLHLACNIFTHLSEHLFVGGDLIVNTCDKLTKLSDDMTVGDELKIINCKKFKGFTGKEKLQGSLTIEICPEFTQIPDHFCLRGGLSILECQNIESLPKGLTLEASLWLENCQKFSTLPADLLVGDPIIIWNCPKMTSIPRTIETNAIGRWRDVISIDDKDFASVRAAANFLDRKFGRVKAKPAVKKKKSAAKLPKAA